jgi:hypothetical protein
MDYVKLLDKKKKKKDRKLVAKVTLTIKFFFSDCLSTDFRIISLKKKKKFSKPTEIYLHFRYLYFVGVVLPTKIVPRSRPSSGRCPLCLVFVQHTWCLAHLVVVERLKKKIKEKLLIKNNMPY